MLQENLLYLGATTAINQNYSGTLDYNRGMRDAGAADIVDVWAVPLLRQTI